MSTPETPPTSPVGLRDLLERYRAAAKSEREKGTWFERLTKLWLERAPTQSGRWSRVLTFTEFAQERGEVAKDTGIDLVAELADEPGRWCVCDVWSPPFAGRRRG